VFFFKDFIYLFDREREHKQGEWQAEAEGEAASPQSRGSPMWDSVPGPRDHDPSQRPLLNQLSHPGAQRTNVFNFYELHCIFCLVDWTFGVMSKKSLPNPGSGYFYACF